jgi:hypothetical protein
MLYIVSTARIAGREIRNDLPPGMRGIGALPAVLPTPAAFQASTIAAIVGLPLMPPTLNHLIQWAFSPRETGTSLK